MSSSLLVDAGAQGQVAGLGKTLDRGEVPTSRMENGQPLSGTVACLILLQLQLLSPSHEYTQAARMICNNDITVESTFRKWDESEQRLEVF